MRETTCVLCPVYFPGADEHAPDRPQTCAAGRRRLERDRSSVLSMYRRLVEQEEEIADTRLRRQTAVPRDPIAALLPMAPTPSPSNKPSVSGSKERQLPINVAVVDLTSAARVKDVRDDSGDQTGGLSVATTLYRWVREWKRHIYPSTSSGPWEGEALLNWIEPRLERIADEEVAISSFAEELGELKGRLRNALGESTPKPIVMWGVPCRRCDTVSSLVLDPEDPDHYRECTVDSCGLLMSEGEYRAWLVELVESLRKERGLRKGASV